MKVPIVFASSGYLGLVIASQRLAFSWFTMRRLFLTSKAHLQTKHSSDDVGNPAAA